MNSPDRAALQAFLDGLRVSAIVIVRPFGPGAPPVQVFEIEPMEGPVTPAARLVPGTLRHDIYRCLEEAETRLTQSQLVDALTAGGREVSDRTVQRELSDLQHDGLVDND